MTIRRILSTKKYNKCACLFAAICQYRGKLILTFLSLLPCSWWASLAWQWGPQEEVSCANCELHEPVLLHLSFCFLWCLKVRSLMLFFCSAEWYRDDHANHCWRLHGLLLFCSPRQELWVYLPWTSDSSQSKLVMLFLQSLTTLGHDQITFWLIAWVLTEHP